MNAAVIHLPFQSTVIPTAHKTLINSLCAEFPVVIFALPVSKVTPTKNNPFDFATREAMIREYFQERSYSTTVFIVPVPAKKYAQDQMKTLEQSVNSPFSGNVPKFVLYSTIGFIKEIHNKVYPKKSPWILPTDGCYGVYLTQEADTRNRRILFRIEPFRDGVNFAMRSQFPISWPTVDIAIRWWCDGKIYYLFGKKPEENGWRFPGGFKDREDPNFETAVLREAGEEVLKPGATTDVFDNPVYISSRNVKDWRYRGEIDGITTLFFMVNYNGFGEDIKAGDDLQDAKWFELSELKPEDIEGEHIHLYNDLVEFEKYRGAHQKCRKCNTVLHLDCGLPVEEKTERVFKENCQCCNGTGTITSAFQMGVQVPCDVCCGVSKDDWCRCWPVLDWRSLLYYSR